MKRPRRGHLTPEDRCIWAEVVRSVRPLPGRRRIDPKAIDTKDVAPPSVEPNPVAPVSGPPATAPAAVTPSRPPVRLPVRVRPTAPPAPPPLAPLERRTTRALARGQRKADATIDLHGLTQVQAHGRLLGFLRGAQASGQGLVLVITGRGSPERLGTGGGERGVLRRTVPLWLALPDMRGLVLGFEEAGTRQGGAGALYVRLRRAR